MDHHIQPEKQISGVEHNLNASRVSFPLGFSPPASISQASYCISKEKNAYKSIVYQRKYINKKESRLLLNFGSRV